jgi:hypothetical protein
VFRFTGGDVHREPWQLVAITSYLEHPFAADRICTNEAARYQDLAVAIMALGHAVVAGRPWTLRARWGIAKAFAEAAAEIRTLGSDLETGLTSLIGELAVSPPSQRGCTPSDPENKTSRPRSRRE